jgi:hypothetical protein
MAGFIPAIHDLIKAILVSKPWMPATGAGMTKVDADRVPLN